MKSVPATSEKKPASGQLLQQLETEEERQATDRLKIFFGYASGVGKSFRMRRPSDLPTSPTATGPTTCHN